MPLTPSEIDALPVYTDAQLLKLYRKALVDFADGKSLTIAGRNLTRADERFVRDMIDWLEARGAASSESEQAVSGNVLVKYGERK